MGREAGSLCYVWTWRQMKFESKKRSAAPIAFGYGLGMPRKRRLLGREAKT
jgi:hypothetical protein